MSTDKQSNRGLTIPVGKYAEALQGRLASYSEQFNLFYQEPHQFTYDELEVLRETAYRLKRGIDDGSFTKGVTITDPETIEILRSSNLLLPENILPANFVIPLYDLVMSKTHQISRMTLPLIIDVFLVGKNLIDKYLYMIFTETDRYQSAILVKTADGRTITFLPGRIWFESAPELSSDIVLDFDFAEAEHMLSDYQEAGILRKMSENERISKVVLNEAELVRGMPNES